MNLKNCDIFSIQTKLTWIILVVLIGISWSITFFFHDIGSMIEIPILTLAITAIICWPLKKQNRELHTATQTLYFRSLISEIIPVADSKLELAQMACDAAISSQDYSMAWIELSLPEDNNLSPLRCHAGHEKGYLTDAPIVWDDETQNRNPTITAIREKRPVVIADFRYHENSDKSLPLWQTEGLKRGHRSSIALPLIVQDQVLGAFTLYRGTPNEFSPEKIKLLMAIANDIALGLSALQMKDLTRTAAKNLEQKELLLSTRTKLLDCAAKYSHKDFLRHALDEISAVVQSPIAFFHQVDDDQDSLTLQDWSTATQRDFCQAEGKGMHYAITDAGVWADSVRTGGPIIHNDYASLPHKCGLPAGHAHVERELVVPIYRGDKPTAILGVGNKSGDYNEKDVEILTYLADVLLELYETKRSSAEWEASQEFNKMLLEAIPFPMDIVDNEGNILFASNKIEQILNKKLIGKRCWEIYKDDKHQCLHCPLHKNPLKSQASSIEVSGVLGGRTFEIFHTAIKYQEKDAILEIFLDITDKKKMQSQLIQADRMASMGMLSAGVAHEINNPLTYTMLNLEEAQEICQKNSTDKKSLEAGQRIADALGGIDKVAKIVQGLKSFSQHEDTTITSLDLIIPIEAAINMAIHEIKYKAKIKKEFHPSLHVRGNEGQLSQVFLNLLINAAHAIPEGDSKNHSISIRTWHENKFIFVSVTDTGSGIKTAHLSKIFDPFFTTKPSGVGSGLGLSITHNIISSMGGEISVKSEVGKGTTMLIKLIADGKTSPIVPIDMTPNSQQDIIQGRFLIIDDDSEIRQGIGLCLEECLIVEAESGVAAQKILAIDQKFDFILCDLLMPKMSGMELYEWIKKEYPQFIKKIIFITGGACNERSEEFLKNVGEQVLNKPFSRDSLRALILKLTLR